MGNSLILVILLLAADAFVFASAGIFAIVSIQEKEHRAPVFGFAGMLFAVILAPGILFIPVLRIFLVWTIASGTLFGAACLLFGRANPKAIQGTMGYVAGQAEQFDERDTVFARQRVTGGGEEIVRRYYDEHPEKEEPDAERRAKGFLGTPGSVDRSYRPNVAMMEASFDMPEFLGPYAHATPHAESLPAEIDPAKATEIVKNLAVHAGADLVGVCRVNPAWVYSHRGEIHYGDWEEWGQELQDFPPYAVVIATEMSWEHVSAAPHTPTVAESAGNYAKGAYLSTLLARWFAHMGYRGDAQNTRNYDTLLVPLAVDAGLGELGRQGYLITPKYGPRVRLFATLTDMPLVPDTPISLGVDEFCRRCKKCAESCPSHSIPLEDKVLFQGVEKWKLDEEGCFDYWRKVGTDCAICMSICPFARPDTPVHNIVRWMIARSPVAQVIFPSIDNMLYGKRWKPRKVPSWLDYPTSKEARKEQY